MTLPSFRTLRTPAATLWSDKSVPEALLWRLSKDPRQIIRQNAARPLKISRESVLVEADVPLAGLNVPVVWKEYRPRNVWKALTAWFRPSRAVCAWRKASLLRELGIATPRPILACQPRGWLPRGISLLASERIEGAENLHLFGWRIAALPITLRLRQANRCAVELGRLLGRMHAAGIAHRDLKAANLLVAADNGFSVCLVDLDGVQVLDRVCSARRACDLARLAIGLAAHPWVTPTVCRRFLRAYLAENSAEAIDWKPFWRAIAHEADRLLRRRLRRGGDML